MRPGAVRGAPDDRDAAVASSNRRTAAKFAWMASSRTVAAVGRTIPLLVAGIRPGLEILEAGLLLEKPEPHGADRAVALLADDDLGHALDVRLRLAVVRIHLFAEDEEHHIRVLLEGAGLTQVGQLRPMIAPGFGRSTELAERENRHVQFLREDLQRPGNRGQLLLPVLELAAALHELQVVDDEHVEAMLQLQATGLRAHLEDADRRRVVDEDLRIVEAAERGGQARVVLLSEVASAEPVRVDSRFGRAPAPGQLLFRHLQAEHPDGLPGFDAAMRGDVQDEAGLAHAGAGGP